MLMCREGRNEIGHGLMAWLNEEIFRLTANHDQSGRGTGLWLTESNRKVRNRADRTKKDMTEDKLLRVKELMSAVAVVEPKRNER